MKKKTITVYEAADGTRFDMQEACAIYEDRDTLLMMYRSLLPSAQPEDLDKLTAHSWQIYLQLAKVFHTITLPDEGKTNAKD